MRIGFDVDGCLADFNTAFIDLIIRLSGRDLFPPRPFDIPTWDYPAVYGYTEDEVGQAWRHIEDSSSFWAELPSYADTFDVLTRLFILQGTHDVYFITSRPGSTAKTQTEEWLRRQFFQYRTVLISGQKGLCARALSLDYYIDDRDKNVVDVRSWYPSCKVFLLDRPWNRELEAETFGIHRVPSALDMLKVIPA